MIIQIIDSKHSIVIVIMVASSYPRAPGGPAMRQAADHPREQYGGSSGILIVLAVLQYSNTNSNNGIVILIVILIVLLIVRIVMTVILVIIVWRKLRQRLGGRLVQQGYQCY